MQGRFGAIHRAKSEAMRKEGPMPQMEQSTPNVEMQSPPLVTVTQPSGSSLAEVAHDAHNMVAALGLYCDLLEEPGVFAEPYRHYGSDLKTVANASRGLVDKLLALCGAETSGQLPLAKSTPEPLGWPAPALKPSKTAEYWNRVPPTPISDLAWELQTNCHLLAALAGPSVALTIDVVGSALPVRLSGEDLTRILVNLIKNSVEAMSGSGGRIQLILRECQTGLDDATRLLLNIEDNGPGIDPEALDRIFEPGYTTRRHRDHPSETTQASHRGLGLSITRSILEAAGGSIRAANRDPVGTCIQIELPACAVSE